MVLHVFVTAVFVDRINTQTECWNYVRLFAELQVAEYSISERHFTEFPKSDIISTSQIVEQTNV
jgi:hypothetical protein